MWGFGSFSSTWHRTQNARKGTSTVRVPEPKKGLEPGLVRRAPCQGYRPEMRSPRAVALPGPGRLR